MPTVSVIVPTYNRADFIGETLVSILNQTFAPDEVIVVDDGSSDNTADVLAGFPSVRVIRAQNGGDLWARNIGMRASRSDLVAFCDSDDLWELDFLEVMQQQWQLQPDLVSCYSNFRILENGAVGSKTKYDDAPADFFDGLVRLSSISGVFPFEIVERLVTFQPLFTTVMMANREKFSSLGGWDEGVSRLVGGDFATALRMASNPPIGIVTKPLAAIRRHPGNYSANTERMNFGDADVLEYVLRTRPHLSCHGAVIRRSIAERRAAAMDSAFSRKAYSIFNKHYCELPPDLKSGKRKIKRVVSAMAEVFHW